MKEATGELNMTLVTIIAIAAVLAFVSLFLPNMLKTVGDKWNTAAGNEINVTVIATGFEVKKNVDMPKHDSIANRLNASDLFANTSFSSSLGSSNTNNSTNTIRRTTPQVSPNFTNIEIPDFLKK